MAVPLMSFSQSFLQPMITLKHVVPWKTREEFINVYEDLFSDDDELKCRAVNKISMWKSRAGSKLSVGIETSGNLTRALIDYNAMKKSGRSQESDFQMRSTLSLSLIRFVNDITEKGQTKAAALPVHIVAKEFDIPEWIVRLRHDATHSNLPSLYTLVVAAKWALDYLKEKFWERQTEDTDDCEGAGQEQMGGPSLLTIRTAIYEYQKIRFQDLKDKSDEKSKGAEQQTYSESLKILQKYLNQNRLKFLKCLLEDGVLVSTEEQLEAFGVRSEDLMYHLPPTIPEEMTEFWSPLLKRIHSSSCLSLLLQTLMFSVTSDESLRNCQLVAWIYYLLAQGHDAKHRLSRKRNHDDLFKSPPSLPRKMLLNACLQNITPYTAFLLKYLADCESLGVTSHKNLTKLLEMHIKVFQDGRTSDSDSDTVHTVEDLKKAKSRNRDRKKFSQSEVNRLQSSVEHSDIPWKLCTDLVDWSTVPFGVIPTPSTDDDKDDESNEPSASDSKRRKDYSSSDDNDDTEYGRRRRRSDDDDDEEEDNIRNVSLDERDDNNQVSRKTKFLASDDIM